MVTSVADSLTLWFTQLDKKDDAQFSLEDVIKDMNSIHQMWRLNLLNREANSNMEELLASIISVFRVCHPSENRHPMINDVRAARGILLKGFESEDDATQRVCQNFCLSKRGKAAMMDAEKKCSGDAKDQVRHDLLNAAIDNFENHVLGAYENQKKWLEEDNNGKSQDCVSYMETLEKIKSLAIYVGGDGERSGSVPRENLYSTFSISNSHTDGCCVFPACVIAGLWGRPKLRPTIYCELHLLFRVSILFPHGADRWTRPRPDPTPTPTRPRPQPNHNPTRLRVKLGGVGVGVWVESGTGRGRIGVVLESTPCQVGWGRVGVWVESGTGRGRIIVILPVPPGRNR